jgi:hypothetical protein
MNEYVRWGVLQILILLSANLVFENIYLSDDSKQQFSLALMSFVIIFVIVSIVKLTLKMVTDYKSKANTAKSIELDGAGLRSSAAAVQLVEMPTKSLN